MLRSRRVALALALVALLGACSSPDDSSPQSQTPPSGAGPTIDPGEDAPDHDAHMGGGGTGGHGKLGPEHGDNGSDDAAESGSGGSDEGDSSGSQASPDQSSPDDSGDDEVEHAPYPAGGAYVYSQKGSEAFCDPAGNCDRYDLPRTQKIATGYGQRSESEAMVITEVKGSNGRYVRTTTHFTPDAAFVTDVYYRVVYEGFEISNQYTPDPPVSQLRFPLRTGREWKASWKAETSGDYHARVTRVQAITVGGATVRAVRLETLTHFRGELDGKASVVMWFDPVTRAIVRTSGALNLRASYGSYNTTFETNLKSAPGY